MVLFVTMVVLAVAIATTVTTGARQRAVRALALCGVALWAAAAAGLAIMSGVNPLLLVLVGAPLGYTVHDLTKRALDARANAIPGQSRAAALLAATQRREPLPWSVIASAGIAAITLEGYWAYQHLSARGGVFSDFGALALFTVLATLTVAGAGAGGLFLHMRTAHRAEQPTIAISLNDVPTVAFPPLQATAATKSRFRRVLSGATHSR